MGQSALLNFFRSSMTSYEASGTTLEGMYQLGSF